MKYAIWIIFMTQYPEPLPVCFGKAFLNMVRITHGVDFIDVMTPAERTHQFN